MPHFSWAQLYSGRKFDFDNFSSEDICLKDIAHALSLIARYNGHTARLYSVAEHSIRVSEILPDDLKLCGLLHDSAEAYVGDMISPLKIGLPQYAELHDRILKVIFDKWRLPWPMSWRVKEADTILLSTEKRDLLGHSEIKWSFLKDVAPLKEPIPLIWAGPEYTEEVYRTAVLRGGGGIE